MTDHNHLVVRLDGLGAKLIAGRRAPKGWDEADALVRHIHAAVNELAELDRAAGAVDRTQPPERQREALMGQHAKALLVTQRARSAVDTAARKLAEATQALEVPPAAADVAAVQSDVELRTYYRAAGPEERSRLDTAMAEGHAPKLLTALARFEVGADAQRGREMFKALARKADPVAVGHLEAATERLSWAETWLREINGALDSATLAGVVAPSSTVVTA